MGHNHRGITGGDPGLDGPHLHHPASNWECQQAGWREMVPQAGAGTGGCRVLPLVVCLWSSTWPTPCPSFIAVFLNVTPGDLLRAPLNTFLVSMETRPAWAWRSADGPSLPHLRLFCPALRTGADGAEACPHRHPACPVTRGVGAVDPAPHGGMGKALAEALHDHRVSAGGAASWHWRWDSAFWSEVAADPGEFEPVQDLVWKLLLSVAFVYMAGQGPVAVGQPRAPSTPGCSTLYFGLNLPGTR